MSVIEPMDNPCVKNCPDRTPTCHGECEKYARYAAWCEERRHERARIGKLKAAGPGLERALKRKQKRERQGRK